MLLRNRSSFPDNVPLRGVNTPIVPILLDVYSSLLLFEYASFLNERSYEVTLLDSFGEIGSTYMSFDFLLIEARTRHISISKHIATPPPIITSVCVLNCLPLAECDIYSFG